MRRRLFALLSLVALLPGCAAPLSVPSQLLPVDEAAYTAVHPFYFEFCALSEIQKKPGYGADIRGGVGGHSTIYLNGVCRVGTAYPEIALCADATGSNGPASNGPASNGPASNGVGLSVNAHFANANWVAIPGRDFFYRGELTLGQPLTRAAYDATKRHAQRLGIYDAIRFHDRVFTDMPPGYTRDAYKYEVSIATDYAIGYGRDRYCARVPVSAGQMSRIVEYLNGLNRRYRDGQAEYEWSVLNDNCIHVAHNALTAIGFWPPWPTHRSILVAAFDFPVPKNEFVNIMRRANDMPVDDLLAVWNDLPARRALLAGQGLPTRPGALETFQPVVPQNPLYETSLRLIFYDDPFFGSYQGWFRKIITQPRYADMLMNSQYFDMVYARIEAGRHPLEWWLNAYPRLASAPDFPEFYSRFYATASQQTASLRAIGAPRHPAAETRG